jgi:hypothetical protein
LLEVALPPSKLQLVDPAMCLYSRLDSCRCEHSECQIVRMVRKVNKPIFKPSKRQGKSTSSDEEVKMEASKS